MSFRQRPIANTYNRRSSRSLSQWCLCPGSDLSTQELNCRANQQPETEATSVQATQASSSTAASSVSPPVVPLVPTSTPTNATMSMQTNATTSTETNATTSMQTNATTSTQTNATTPKPKAGPSNIRECLRRLVKSFPKIDENGHLYLSPRNSVGTKA